MSNNLANVVPTILKYGLTALRENAVLARYVTTDFSTEVAAKGKVIGIPISTSMAATNVTPGTPATTDIVPGVANIELSNWKEVGFLLSDKEIKEIDENAMLVGQASEAIKSLANAVEKTIIAQGLNFYGMAGATGVTPFASTPAELISARALMGKQLAPMNDRVFALDSAAAAKALGLSLFTQAYSTGDNTLKTGVMGNRFGFDFVENQNIEGNVLTKGSGALTAYIVNNASFAIGATSVAVTAGTGNIVVGEVFTVAGDTQQYVVTEAYAGGAGTVKFYPAAKVAWANSAIITLQSAYAQMNLCWQKGAIGLATRPLDTPDGLGVISSSAVDPISGLTLRLEVQRTYKQTRWSWDILWGVGTIQRERGVRLLG
jgi:hypothetical protein